MSPQPCLILVRHSLPEIEEKIPARRWKLSNEGRERAGRLAERLTQYEPDILVSSSEPKAQETASIIGRQLGLTNCVMNGLHEHDRTNLPFYYGDEFQSLVRKFFEKPDTLVFGNETASQALLRFQGAVDLILKSFADKNIIIVTHGTVISLFVAWLTGNNGYLLWKELSLPSFVELDMQFRTLIKTENIT